MTSLSDLSKSKKIIIVAACVTLVALIAVIALVLLTGNDTSSSTISTASYTKEKKAMKECVEGLVECISNGDSESAMSYCNESSASSLGLSSMDAESFRSTILEEIGIAEENLYTPTSDALDTMISTTATDFVRKNTVSNVKNIKKGKDGKITGEVELTITGISDFNSLSFSDSVTTANEDLVTYINSDMDNLMNSLESQGHDNMKLALINHTLVKLFTDMTDTVPSIPSTEKSYLVQVSANKDKKGNLSTIIEKVSVLD